MPVSVFRVRTELRRAAREAEHLGQGNPVGWNVAAIHEWSDATSSRLEAALGREIGDTIRGLGRRAIDLASRCTGREAYMSPLATASKLLEQRAVSIDEHDINPGFTGWD